MILQNLVLPKEGCPCEKLYIRRYDSDEGECMDFCTYFNVFPVARWMRYSEISDIYLDIESKGQVTLMLIGIGDCQEELSRIDVSGHSTLSVPDSNHRLIGVRLILSHGSGFVRGSFCTRSVPERMPTMVLDMCTFHREVSATEKIRSFIESLECFGESYSKHVHMIVVDNGSTLEGVDHASVDVVMNGNIGGSGGFARGLHEARNSIPDLTHILFMDDDTVMDFESVYRVFVLMCFVRSEYSGYMVAGLMLNMERPHEIYESGRVLPSNDPIGRGIDVSDVRGVSLLDSLSNPDAGGWWFFCSPHVSSNDYPMPFFVGYDDVAYSAMHGSSVLSMTGVGVWHPDPGAKYRPSRLFYYDVRNRLFFNAFTSNMLRMGIISYFKRGMEEIMFMRPRNADLMSMALSDFSRGCMAFDDPVGTNDRIQSEAYIVRDGDSPEFDANNPVHNNMLWTILTINGQLLPGRGCGKASKTCLDAEFSYRVQRMLHYDDESGWFITEKDVRGSICSMFSLFVSAMKACVRCRRISKELSENNNLVSESYWKNIFDEAHEEN